MLRKDQHIFPLKIILSFLITSSLDEILILSGEVWCWSLLGSVLPRDLPSSQAFKLSLHGQGVSYVSRDASKESHAGLGKAVQLLGNPLFAPLIVVDWERFLKEVQRCFSLCHHNIVIGSRSELDWHAYYCTAQHLESESRDKQLQIERRRKASLFISMLKKTNPGDEVETNQ